MSAHIEDFDVTYSTRTESIDLLGAEGLQLTMHASIISRPIISELYELDSEIGPRYYEEVVGPEFRSAAHAVFAKHSYIELSKTSEKIEDEIEADAHSGKARRDRVRHLRSAEAAAGGGDGASRS